MLDCVICGVVMLAMFLGNQVKNPKLTERMWVVICNIAAALAAFLIRYQPLMQSVHTHQGLHQEEGLLQVEHTPLTGTVGSLLGHWCLAHGAAQSCCST